MRISGWSLSSTCVLFYVLLLFLTCNASFLFKSFGLSVSKGKGNRRRTKTTNVVPDDYSGLEYVQNTYAAIAKSAQVAALKYGNRTVVAYSQPKSGSDLQESIGCKTLYPLLPTNSAAESQIYLVLTGLVGDCRAVVRHLKQVALNHTMKYDLSPSGELLANNLNRFIQSQRAESSRLLAVHAFIISANAFGGRCIYEVGATGSVQSVLGGTAGGTHMKKARQLLELHYKRNMSLEEVQSLLLKLFDRVLDSRLDSHSEPPSEGSGEGGGGKDGETEIPYILFEIPDIAN